MRAVSCAILAVKGSASRTKQERRRVRRGAMARTPWVGSSGGRMEGSDWRFYRGASHIASKYTDAGLLVELPVHATIAHQRVKPQLARYSPASWLRPLCRRDCFRPIRPPQNALDRSMPPAGKLGFRVLGSPPRLDASLVDRFRRMATPNLADAMGRFNFMDPGILSRTGLPLCGLAVTVNARPADNLMVHKALQVASPGDVIVVNTCGNTTSAVFGELMCNTAVAAKLGGIVVDGAIRDVDGLAALAFPAFSRSVSAGGCD